MNERAVGTPRRGTRRGLRTARFVAGAVAAIICLGVTLWWRLPGDPVRVLEAHRAALVQVVRTAAPESTPEMERWSLVDARGDTFTALWRAASPAEEPPPASGPSRVSRPWTVVLLGGLRTGERAAALLPPCSAHVLALDWPWSGPRTLSTWQFLARLPAIRAALLGTPAVLALGIEAVARQPEVDSTRIALLGASLGVPPALAALRLAAPRPQACILLHGGADLRVMLQHAIVRQVGSDRLAPVGALLGARLLHPLEPALHAGAARGLPILLLSAKGDEKLPEPSVLALHAALPHAEVRWETGAHMRPTPEVLAPYAREVETWLAALRWR